MDLFANVGNVQQKMGYSQHERVNETHHQKAEEINKPNKDKPEEQIHKEQETITKEKLQDLAHKLNKEMEPLNPDITFHFNDKIDNFVINVVDKNTDKVIRKIPSNEALKIMEKMRELVGALFDNKG